MTSVYRPAREKSCQAREERELPELCDRFRFFGSSIAETH